MAKKTNYNLPKGVYQRGERTFRFRVYNGSDSNGKPIYQYKRYEVKSIAKKDIERELRDEYSAFEKSVKNGCSVDERITLREYYYDHWLPSCGKQLSPAEREGNIRTMEKLYLPKLGGCPLASIRRINIQEITNSLSANGLSPKTIRKYHSQIATVFSEALRLELIESTPCEKIRFPKMVKRNEVRVFTAEQAMRFLDACRYGITVHYPESVRSNGRTLPAHSETVGGNFMLFVLYNLALNTGMRRGELCALTWKSIDFKHNQIAIKQAASRAKSENGFFIKSPKTETSNRVITVPKVVMDTLREWKLTQADIRKNLGSAWHGTTDENQLVFTASDGSGMDLNYPVRAMHRIIEGYNKTCFSEAEKLPALSLHELRHTHATLLIQAGVPISEVSRRLGHSDIAVTLSVYAHWLPENDKAASDAIAKVFAGQTNCHDKKWNEFGTNRDETRRNNTQRN